MSRTTGFRLVISSGSGKGTPSLDRDVFDVLPANAKMAFVHGLGSVLDVSGQFSLRGVERLMNKSIRQKLLDDRLTLQCDGIRVHEQSIGNRKDLSDLKLHKPSRVKLAPKDQHVVVRQIEKRNRKGDIVIQVTVAPSSNYVEGIEKSDALGSTGA